MTPKILLLDCETSPNIVHCWGLFNQFIGINQIVEPSKVISWAAKWYGTKEILFDSINDSSPKEMLGKIHKLINEADIIIHYNGKSFDMPVLSRDFILNGFTPPQPAQEIDLLTVVRRRFKFASNKLQYVVKALGIGEKVSHEGHELWVKCLDGDQKAWQTMRKYNCQDVQLLEDLYTVVKGWVRNHPNIALYTDGSDMLCPNCGCNHLSKRGFRKTRSKLYQRFQCGECGAWSSNRLSERRDDKNVLA